jgi:hypothetical protein
VTLGETKSAATGMSNFREQAAGAALYWKAHSTTLPEAARQPGHYGNQPDSKPMALCLPAAYAKCNLLPDVGDAALQLFSDEQIVWHGSVNGGPSNHLLDS